MLITAAAPNWSSGTVASSPSHEATRAWNFFSALYYKAGGTPWRVIRDQREFSATFMGVSFFEMLDGSSLQTSSAQLFDERGEGLI